MMFRRKKLVEYMLTGFLIKSFLDIGKVGEKKHQLQVLAFHRLGNLISTNGYEIRCSLFMNLPTNQAGQEIHPDLLLYPGGGGRI